VVAQVLLGLLPLRHLGVVQEVLAVDISMLLSASVIRLTVHHHKEITLDCKLVQEQHPLMVVAVVAVTPLLVPTAQVWLAVTVEQERHHLSLARL
jgi:hypothetical protein